MDVVQTWLRVSGQWIKVISGRVFDLYVGLRTESKVLWVDSGGLYNLAGLAAVGGDNIWLGMICCFIPLIESGLGKNG